MLKTTAAHYGGDWSDHDHVVLENGNVVGRIMLHPQGPQGKPWLWSITSRMPQSPEDHGYAESRERVMAEFKAPWMAA